MIKMVVDLLRKVEKLERQNQIMCQALEKLANPDNWSDTDVSNFTTQFDYALPQEIAQKALQEIEQHQGSNR